MTVDRSLDRRDARDALADRMNAPLTFVTPKVTRLSTPKMVTAKPTLTDARSVERGRLLDLHLTAIGKGGVTRATEAILSAGFAIPDTQEHHLQILDHEDESRVRDAITSLGALLMRETARRVPLLEQRLHRIAEHAEDTSTRAAASQLARKLR